MSDAMKIALSGLQDATLRVANSAQNLANASTTGELPSEANNQTTTAYAPHDVISVSQSVGNTNLGVSSTTAAREPAYVPASDPTSPFANEAGLVAAPNVDLTTEILNAQMAAAAYQANASVIKTVADNEKSLINAVSA